MKRMYSQEELSALGGTKLYKHTMSIYSSIMTKTWTGYIISTSKEKYSGTALSVSIPIISYDLASSSSIIVKIVAGASTYSLYSSSTSGQYLSSLTNIPITTIEDVVSEL